MHDFDYLAPTSLEAARDAFAQAEEARYLAGGQTLIPIMRQRLAAPRVLIDLGRVAGLAGISTNAHEVRIGAMTPHADVAASAEVRRLLPALAALAASIGDPQVRNRGTIGGSLANNDPSADYPAGVLGLGATIITDRRHILADDYFQGLFTTALADGEIITAVAFPVPRRAAYARMAHRASRFAMTAVMVSEGPTGVRVAVTGAGQNGVFRFAAAEAALTTSLRPDALEGIGLDASQMLSDLHAPGAYRAHLAAVLTRRAVASMS